MNDISSCYIDLTKYEPVPGFSWTSNRPQLGHYEFTPELSDKDVERIARRVRELLKEAK